MDLMNPTITYEEAVKISSDVAQLLTGQSEMAIEKVPLFPGRAVVARSFVFDANFLDILNPSGEACNSFASCAGKLVSADGTPFQPEASWHSSLTMDIVAGSYCVTISPNLVIEGIDCRSSHPVICKYDCFNLEPSRLING